MLPGWSLSGNRHDDRSLPWSFGLSSLTRRCKPRTDSEWIAVCSSLLPSWCQHSWDLQQLLSSYLGMKRTWMLCLRDHCRWDFLFACISHDWMHLWILSDYGSCTSIQSSLVHLEAIVELLWRSHYCFSSLSISLRHVDPTRWICISQLEGGNLRRSHPVQRLLSVRRRDV